MVLFFTIHFPSLWSQSCDRGAMLAEHAIYHAILHALILAALEASDFFAWNAAAYLAVYYAWRICLASHSNKYSTLSPTFLSIVMLSSLPVVIFTMIPVTPFSANGHLVAWSVADIASFLHTFKKKNNNVCAL
jgi:hypothetical protein